MLKAQMKIFPSSRVTRIHTMGANSALWIMAEKRYLQEDVHVCSSVQTLRGASVHEWLSLCPTHSVTGLPPSVTC